MPVQNKGRPLLEQITQSPLLINSTAADLFSASVSHLVNSEHAGKLLDAAASNDNDFWGDGQDSWYAQVRPYNVTSEGILQIPVMGVLLHRFPYQFGRWATGYAYIEKALQRGLEDSNVKGIAFIIDSPGGEVAGCFELADKIFEARGEKPMRSFAADHAYSAAYMIFSASDTGSVTRSGGVGSIGVVTAHVDYSGALEQMGIKVTFIFAGEHKVDGNPYEKLPDKVKSRIQARIDRIYGVFTSSVARNRSMGEDEVIATQALTYDANEAIEVGLADKIGALEDEMEIFANDIAETENETMAVNDNTNTGIDKATHDAAVLEATATGARAEKARIKGILASEEGKKRPKAALSCALNSDMSSEQALTFLADLAEEKTTATVVEEPKPVAKQTPFETAMDTSGNPDVGALGGKGTKDEDEDTDAAATNSILDAFASATGKKRTKAA